MSEKVETVAKTFLKSGPLGKVIIGAIIFVIACFGLIMWFQVQNQTMIKEVIRLNGNIELMVSNQENIGVLKQKVKTSLDSSNDYFNNEFSMTLGKILQGNGIQFPQGLNAAFQKYRKHVDEIKDCLIE